VRVLLQAEIKVFTFLLLHTILMVCVIMVLLQAEIKVLTIFHPSFGIIAVGSPCWLLHAQVQWLTILHPPLPTTTTVTLSDLSLPIVCKRHV
jgi:hypothetical protein